MRLLPRCSVVVFTALVAACAQREPVVAPVVVVAPPAVAPFAAERHAVLRCPGRVPVALEFGTGLMRIEGASSRRTLRAADTASGELYEDADVRLWITGESALFGQPGGASPLECRVQPARDAWDSARRRGVALRASGDNGRWWFEYLPEKWLLMATGAGEVRAMMLPSAPVVEDDGWHLVVDDGKHSLALHAQAVPCRDGAAGDTQELQVSIRLDGIAYAGCGRWLSP